MRKALVLLINLFAFAPFTANAVELEKEFFQYFGGRDIDYWQQGNRVKDPYARRKVQADSQAPKSSLNEQKTGSDAFSGSTLVRQGDAKKFAWSRYSDPRAPEFWDDGGDWIPPRPFREAAADPTAENVQQYLTWQANKTAVVNRFQTALSAHAISFDRWKELSVAYFYQSTCAACRASVRVVDEALKRGAKFTFVQLDAGEHAPLHTPSVPYTAEWKKQFAVDATPTWFLKLGSRTATLTGSVSIDELARQAAALQ